MVKVVDEIVSFDATTRVLIVDDMPAMRSIVRNMLEEAGFKNIDEAEDGEMAWHLLRQSVNDSERPFSLVIADWNMPGSMSGVDLLRAIRALPHTRNLPFFMVTGQRDEKHLSEAMRAGVTGYVVKPFTAEQLREKLEHSLSP
jgi:two-component system chemotaxis response regulator CheY